MSAAENREIMIFYNAIFYNLQNRLIIFPAIYLMF